MMRPSEIAQLKAALGEDTGRGDMTSRLLINKGAKGRAVIVAREAGIFCGVEVARRLFRLADRRIKIRFRIHDGRRFARHQTLLEIRGPVRGILAAERTVLNFLQHLCGIATRTQAFVRRLRKYRVRILDTRKTTPLWRGLEKYAVKCGGGENHRFGLADEIFVKENHRPFGNLKKLRRYSGKFIIETRNLREVAAAMKLRPRVILMDNFKPAALKRAVKIVRRRNPKIILEASGGVTLQNVAAFARAGVDQISIGSLTHSVKAVDLSLLIV